MSSTIEAAPDTATFTAAWAGVAVTDDAVDDAGRDSFPASDPPTWWAGNDERGPKSEEGAAPWP